MTTNKNLQRTVLKGQEMHETSCLEMCLKNSLGSLLGLLETSGKIHSSHKLNQGPIIWETVHNEHMDDWKGRDCRRQ